MCKCVYGCEAVCAHVCRCICVHLLVYMYACARVNAYVWVSVSVLSMCACWYMCMYTNLCVHVVWCVLLLRHYNVCVFVCKHVRVSLSLYLFSETRSLTVFFVVVLFVLI